MTDGAPEDIRLGGLVAGDAGLAQDIYLADVLDPIPVEPELRLQVETAQFDPGAASAWTHGHGVSLVLVTHGAAYVERRDGDPPVELIQAGSVHVEPQGVPRRLVNASATRPFGCFRVCMTPTYLEPEVAVEGPVKPRVPPAVDDGDSSSDPAGDLLIAEAGGPVRRQVHLDRPYPYFPKVPQLQVRVAVGELAPGGTMPWHLHNGGGLFLVLRGECVIETRDVDEPEHYRPGDVLFEPIGVVHRGINPSATQPYSGIGLKYCHPGLDHDILESWLAG